MATVARGHGLVNVRTPKRHRACKPPGADVIARISGFPRNLRTYPSRPRAFKSTGCLSAIRRAKSGSRRGCEEWTGRSRLQWTAAQDGPRTGRQQSPAAMRGNRSTEGESGYHQLLHARPARGQSTPVCGSCASARLLCHARTRLPVSTMATSRGGERLGQRPTLETCDAIDPRLPTVRLFRPASRARVSDPPPT
jgi:hypothetical protein